MSVYWICFPLPGNVTTENKQQGGAWGSTTDGPRSCWSMGMCLVKFCNFLANCIGFPLGITFRICFTSSKGVCPLSSSTSGSAPRSKSNFISGFNGVKVPIAVLGAEIDKLSPPALVKGFEEALAAKNEVDGFVEIFPKASHGWTVRYDVNDELAMKMTEEPHEDMLDWFTKYFK